MKEREVGGIWRGEGKLVYRRNHTGINDGPLEVAGGLAANDTRGRGSRVARIGRRGLGGVLARGEELCDTKVTLGRGGQEVVLGILRGCKQEQRGRRCGGRT